MSSIFQVILQNIIFKNASTYQSWHALLSLPAVKHSHIFQKLTFLFPLDFFVHTCIMSCPCACVAIDVWLTPWWRTFMITWSACSQIEEGGERQTGSWGNLTQIGTANSGEGCQAVRHWYICVPPHAGSCVPRTPCRCFMSVTNGEPLCSFVFRSDFSVVIFNVALTYEVRFSHQSALRKYLLAKGCWVYQRQLAWAKPYWHHVPALLRAPEAFGS